MQPAHRSLLAALLAALATQSALAAEPSESAKPAKTADELMAQAHAGRAVWREFPGFKADLAVAEDGKATTGMVEVAADGGLTIQLADPQGFEWVERTLRSVVNHRLSDDAPITGVEFADDQVNHPLGRLLKSKSAADKSLWRVQGSLLTEVHRFSDKTHMVISIGEVAWNAEKKHLPRSYTVTTWNTATGAIESTRQLHNEWARIVGWDLPTRLLAATSRAGGTRSVEEIKLTGHRLAAVKSAVTFKVTELAPLKAPMTSFGAAVAAGHLYIFGGHLGNAHKYSAELQAHQLLRLNLAKPTEWEVVGEGPRRTGLAMVAYGGRIYRLGGWEAKNKDGDEWDLHSQPDFARFDPKTGQWTVLAPLPEGRSSHDAALVGSKLYVVGGWKLAGKGSGDWHETAYVCDLAQDNPQWAPIAKPPFNRRALAVAGYREKLYVIGGMDDSNDTTTATNVYDPASNQWSVGPSLPGKPFDGFGAAAFGTGAGLFATTREGLLCRLANSGKAWEEVGKLTNARSFHRLVADGDQRLLVVGGTGPGGKVAAVESIELTIPVGAQ